MKERLSVPPEFRTRLEMARLELLTLFRALDRLSLTAEEIPQDELHELFELDADFAKALLVLDRPPHGIVVKLMLDDTEASFDALPEARENFLTLLPDSSRKLLAKLQVSIRKALTLQDAYNSIPGRDPHDR